MNSYGYVYKPGTPEEKIWECIDRSFRVDETNCRAILENGWNPRDVWTFVENCGIIGPYFAPENPPTEEEKAEMKKIAEKWNHKYIHGYGDEAPGYSLISSIYRFYGKDGMRLYCMCVDDWDSKWHVKCVSFPDEEFEAYWEQKRKENPFANYTQVQREFFNERCKYHKHHGYPCEFEHIPNATKFHPK